MIETSSGRLQNGREIKGTDYIVVSGWWKFVVIVVQANHVTVLNMVGQTQGGSA